MAPQIVFAQSFVGLVLELVETAVALLEKLDQNYSGSVMGESWHSASLFLDLFSPLSDQIDFVGMLVVGLVVAVSGQIAAEEIVAVEWVVAEEIVLVETIVVEETVVVGLVAVEEIDFVGQSVVVREIALVAQIVAAEETALEKLFVAVEEIVVLKILLAE